MKDKFRHSAFLIVDDSPIDVFIAERILKTLWPESTIHKYPDAIKALDFLKDSTTRHVPTIVLLDIYMPTMDGFAFLGEFDKFSEEVKNNYSIYIVSSSSNQLDLSRASANKYVQKMLLKPLTKESLLNLLENSK